MINRRGNGNDYHENDAIPNPVASSVVDLLYEGVDDKNGGKDDQGCLLRLGEQSCKNNAVDDQPEAGKKVQKALEMDMGLVLRRNLIIIFLFRRSFVLFHFDTAFPGSV